MPILAIGNRRFASDAGVTLVEAMVALMIVGLMVGAVVLMAPGPEAKIREEADRLAARIVLAGEESIILNRSMSLVVTGDGYGFERLESAGWIEVEPNSPLGFRAWPTDIDVEVEQSQAGPDDPRVARFDALGEAAPTRILISGPAARWRVSVDGQGGVDVARAE